MKDFNVKYSSFDWIHNEELIETTVVPAANEEDARHYFKCSMGDNADSYKILEIK